MNFYIVERKLINKCSESGICVCWCDKLNCGITEVNDKSSSVIGDCKVAFIEQENKAP